jgi:hypothetical protein
MTLHHRNLPAVLVLATLTFACSSKDVVAEVGSTKLRAADIEAFQAGRRGDASAALDTIVQRALLAEAGRKAGLDDDPRLRARIEQARREILAQAYLERQMEAATREDALHARYVAEKERLAHPVVHVAHLAVHEVASDPASHAAAQSNVSRAAARLAAGEPFEKVVKQTSDDVMTAAKGGDLGPIEEGQVDPAFFQVVVLLKKGETSKPFQTAYGWHIARALEDPRTVTPEFEQVKGVLTAEARREAEVQLVERLRGDIRVRVHRDRLPAPEATKTEKVRVGEGR